MASLLHARTHNRAHWFTLLSLFALALTSVLTVTAQTTAHAHNVVVETNPAQDAQLQTAPAVVSITFSASVLTTGASEVAVTDADGASHTTGETVVDGATVSVPVDIGTTAGHYQVAYSVVSEDGHRISAAYQFTVGDPDTSEATPSASANAETETAAAQEDSSATGNGSGWLPWALGGVGVAAVIVVVAVVATRRR